MTITYIDNGPLLYFPLWWHTKGLQQTMTGYGSKLTTPYKTVHNGMMFRVYATCYGNSASLYIVSKKQQLNLKNTLAPTQTGKADLS